VGFQVLLRTLPDSEATEIEQQQKEPPMKNLTKKFSALLVAGGIAAGVAITMTATTTPAAAAGPVAVNQPLQQRNNTTHPTTTNPTTSPSGTSKPTPEIDPASSTGTINTQMMHRPGQAVAGTDSGRWTSMYDFMSFVVQDTASVWNWYYQQWGKGVSSVHYVFSTPGQVIYSACGGTPLTDTSSPFYCRTDDTIYFSQVRAQWYWNNAGGDFAVATAIAHEYGHNIQAELGINPANYTSMQFEQEADCFSGAFAHVAYYQGILDHNDINEALASRALVADNGLGPDAHGTAQARQTAYLLGYNSNGPAACDTILTH
jgi:uncharacterized protein